MLQFACKRFHYKTQKEGFFMKKIINDPHDVVPEMVNGMTRAYPQYIEKIEGTEAVVRSDKDRLSSFR